MAKLYWPWDRFAEYEAEIDCLRSDLSTALARNAEIEGETIERCKKIIRTYGPASDFTRDGICDWIDLRSAAAIRSSAQEKADG